MNLSTSYLGFDLPNPFIADALELNVYFVATYAGESAAAIEQRKVEMVREIKKAIHRSRWLSSSPPIILP